MPRGDKSAYTDKQKRQAEHIEEGYKKEGVSDEVAEARAWATVNKQDGGGKKSGSGRAGARKTSGAKRSSKSAGTGRKSSSAKRSAKSTTSRRKAPRKATKAASKRKS